jgi:hypothetical protein
MRKDLLSSFMLLIAISTVTVATRAAAAPPPVISVDSYLRTELYFGMARPDGSHVSEAEWDKFVDEVIVPRFPDGFTVMSSIGHYRGRDGKIIREPSRVLIILYDRNSKKLSRAKVEEIRTAYKKMFEQESVLRMDLPKSVNVTF